jgi:hypothetical protein
LTAANAPVRPVLAAALKVADVGAHDLEGAQRLMAQQGTIARRCFSESSRGATRSSGVRSISTGSRNPRVLAEQYLQQHGLK